MGHTLSVGSELHVGSIGTFTAGSSTGLHVGRQLRVEAAVSARCGCTRAARPPNPAAPQAGGRVDSVVLPSLQSVGGAQPDGLQLAVAVQATGEVGTVAMNPPGAEELVVRGAIAVAGARENLGAVAIGGLAQLSGGVMSPTSGGTLLINGLEVDGPTPAGACSGAGVMRGSDPRCACFPGHTGEMCAEAGDGEGPQDRMPDQERKPVAEAGSDDGGLPTTVAIGAASGAAVLLAAAVIAVRGMRQGRDSSVPPLLKAGSQVSGFGVDGVELMAWDSGSAPLPQAAVGNSRPPQPPPRSSGSLRVPAPPVAMLRHPSIRNASPGLRAAFIEQEQRRSQTAVIAPESPAVQARRDRTSLASIGPALQPHLEEGPSIYEDPVACVPPAAEQSTIYTSVRVLQSVPDQGPGGGGFPLYSTSDKARFATARPAFFAGLDQTAAEDSITLPGEALPPAPPRADGFIDV